MDKQDFQTHFQISNGSFDETPTKSLLDEWLITDNTFDNNDEQLKNLSKLLLRHVQDWNEEELKMNFISLLLAKVDFYGESYNPFFDRELTAEFRGKILSGKVDFLVASGTQFPIEPYFFIHEYKKEMDSSNDPLAQLLIEMAAAILLNEKRHPIYGSYVVGRHWYFVVLTENEYAVSLAFDATKDDIVKITNTLKAVKQLIEQCAKTD